MLHIECVRVVGEGTSRQVRIITWLRRYGDVTGTINAVINLDLVDISSQGDEVANVGCEAGTDIG